MRKVVSSRQILASTALAASLAIFGCTTNKMPGDGQPTSMPYNSPATSAPTNGTSGGTHSGNFTMISSGPASMTTPSVDAYAQIANQQGFRGRILGPSFPGQADISASVEPTGQFQNPALVANPEVTVNRSSSSEPTPAIINDSGAGIAIVSGGTTAAATVAGTGAVATAPLTNMSAATASPSRVVIGTPTPTQSSAGVLSPTVAGNPASVVRSSGTGTTTTTTASAAITSPATTPSRAVGNLTVSTATSRTRGVRLTTSSTGTPLITNAR